MYLESDSKQEFPAVFKDSLRNAMQSSKSGFLLSPDTLRIACTRSRIDSSERDHQHKHKTVTIKIVNHERIKSFIRFYP